MKKIDIPLTIAITTWRSENSIQKTIESVVDLADFIVIAHGRTPESKNSKPDKTLQILQHLQVDYPDLITILYTNLWENEVQKLNAVWYQSIGYYFRLNANESLDNAFKKELLDAISHSINENKPIIAKTTTIKSGCRFNFGNANYKFRGCQVDFARQFYHPEIPPEPFSSKHSLQLECPITILQ